MEYIAPSVIRSVHLTDIVNPAFHTLKLVFQNALIPIEQIQIPWNDAGRIAPYTRCAFHTAGRNNIRYFSAKNTLFFRHIIEIFCIKCVGIFQVCRGRGEYLRVSGPAHPFVSLRAIRRYVQEIPLHAPAHILDQTIHKIVSCRHRSDRIQITVQRHTFQILFFQVRNPLHLYITITIICKMRDQYLFASVCHKEIFRFGAS